MIYLKSKGGIFMEKNLKKILELRDRSFVAYDYIRLTGYDAPFKEMEEIHQKLTDLLWESIGDYSPVYVVEDCIIKPGETLELKTDISKLGNIEENRELEFISEGIIPSKGFLFFALAKDKQGNKIFVTNNVSKKALEEHNSYGYHFCDPLTIKYCGPGIYKINAHTIIGLAGFKQKALNFQDQQVMPQILSKKLEFNSLEKNN